MLTFILLMSKTALNLTQNMLLHIVSCILSPYSHSLVVFIETDYQALLRLRLGRSINERFPTDSRPWLLCEPWCCNKQVMREFQRSML